jgi:hypothetical protein
MRSCTAKDVGRLSILPVPGRVVFICAWYHVAMAHRPSAEHSAEPSSDPAEPVAEPGIYGTVSPESLPRRVISRKLLIPCPLPLRNSASTILLVRMLLPKISCGIATRRFQKLMGFANERISPVTNKSLVASSAAAWRPTPTRCRPAATPKMSVRHRESISGKLSSRPDSSRTRLENQDNSQFPWSRAAVGYHDGHRGANVRSGSVP